MNREALEMRRAALTLMDAADLLEDGRKPEARAHAERVFKVLETVFWPPESEADGPADTNHTPDEGGAAHGAQFAPGDAPSEEGQQEK